MKNLILFLPILLALQVQAQKNDAGSTTSDCPQRDLGDVVRVVLDKPPKDTSQDGGAILLIPIIGSNPATGFVLGVGGQYAFKAHGNNTRYSMISGSAQFTTKSQQLYLLKNNIYSKNNKIFFTGDWRYLIYSQSTYGLGTNAPEGGILDYQIGVSGLETAIDSLAQPLNFNFLRLYQSVSFNVKKSFYIGVGYYLDSYFDIQDEKLRLNPGDSLITSHYSYSTFYGFDQKKYFSSALGINLVSDTRDNMINAYKGYFAVASWNASIEFLGSDRFANFFSFEWRSFHPLSSRNPRHLLAFWGLVDLTPDGEAPYLTLPATSYDQRSRSGRGYTQGRFRGSKLVYGEAEYRFPISPCGGLWGGVLFINATSANNQIQELDLFQSVKLGYGFGFRLMVDKDSRTNLAIDFGFGEKSFGFYLAASETF